MPTVADKRVSYIPDQRLSLVFHETDVFILSPLISVYRIPYNPPKKRLYKIGTKSTINRTITAKINAPYSILL